MIKKITNITKKISKLKIRFDLPYRRKILLYDELHSSILKEIIDKDFNIFKVRENKDIYFWILLKQLFFFDFSFVTYCKNYIKHTSPVLIITFIDNNIEFYKLKNNFKNIIFISIQNGVRYKKWFTDKRLNNTKNLKCDHFFVFNKYYEKEYKKYIDAKYHLFGNFKNNLVDIGKTKIYGEYLYLSSPFPDKKSRDSEIKLLNNLNLYLTKLNIKLHILLKYKDSLRQEKEIIFYKKIFHSNCIFKKISDWKKSYQILDKFENIIFMSTSLGYEAISRKKKVAIFLPNEISDFDDFGWPAPFKKIYKFFLGNKLTFDEINRVLNNIGNCSQEDWEKNFYSKIYDQLNLDRNNESLKKVIFDII